MNPLRWQVLVPVALTLTLLSPALRGLEMGPFLPDPWLLILLLAVSTRSPSLRPAVRWAFALGLLRASVSAASPFSCWAGLGLGLLLRNRIEAQLSPLSPWVRFLVGAAAAVPLALLDSFGALALSGASLEPSVMGWRICLSGCAWVFLARRAPRLSWSKR